MKTFKRPLVPVLALVLCLAVAALGISSASSGAAPTASVAKKCKKGFKKVRRHGKTKCKKITAPVTPAALKPALAIAPASATIVSVNQAPTAQPFQVSNTGTGPTANLVTTVTTTPGSYGQFVKSGGDCGPVLAAGAKCTVVVLYIGGPNNMANYVGVTGTATGSLTASDAANGVSATAILNGTSFDSIFP